jgi:drug/metabolite transporter (DMT)-like permease
MDNNKKTAGALDVRNIIGLLMAIYGVILLLTALFSDSTAPKSADVNSNLWAGLALLVVGGVFLTWARLRPIRVPEDVPVETNEPPGQNTPPGQPQH